MAEIHHLSHGWITPAVSYLFSVLGSLLGLVCAVRLRKSPTGGGRIWWLVLAAVAIGGTGIWTMHFVAMLGFDVVGTQIRYDVGLTAASAIIAVGAVGVGLSIALLGSGARHVRVVVGGIIAGLAVAGMHYTGMAAMRLDGTIHYETTRVALSIAIAVVAATVALWLTVTVNKPLIIFVSALIMGVAVNAMHFTGMTAMSVEAAPAVGPVTGASVSQLLVPIGVAVIFGVFGLVFALMAAPTEEDRAGLAYIAARQEAAATAPRLSQEPPATIAPPMSQRPQPQRPQPKPPVVPAPPLPPSSGPTLGQRLSNLQADLADDGPVQDTDPRIPGQRTPRRMPTTDSSWTFRDRAEK
jgi:NO-binding membrane sensor protein with MHYT domain